MGRPARASQNLLLLAVQRCAGYRRQGSTSKATFLATGPPGVVTRTMPVVAPEGTVVSIKELEITSNWAAVPLKATAVAPVRSVPRIPTFVPTVPALGFVSTNRFKP